MRFCTFLSKNKSEFPSFKLPKKRYLGGPAKGQTCKHNSASPLSVLNITLICDSHISVENRRGKGLIKMLLSHHSMGEEVIFAKENTQSKLRLESLVQINIERNLHCR